MNSVEITYFSDILCIWAYASQARVNAVKDKFADAIRLEHRFVSVFGDTATKITSTWKDKGGYEGFNSHLRQVAERFPHVEVHPDIWLTTRPSTSASAQLFIKAAQQCETESEVAGSKFDARQDKGWLIVFLGAGLAAAQQGTAMGVQAGSVANIGMDEQSLHNTMPNVRCMIDDYAATRDLADAKAYAAKAAFSIKARAAMGDPSGGAGLVNDSDGKPLDPGSKVRKQASSLPKSPDDTWASSNGDAWGA
jgi:hypothetical protein